MPAPTCSSVGVRTFALILALALALRLAVAALAQAAGNLDSCYAPDSPGYLALAEGLARDGRFATASGPEIVRTPGYSVLLIPGVLLGQPAAAAIIIQALLGTLTVALAAALNLDIAGKRAALTTALLAAVEPLSLLYGAKILSETAFTAALTSGLFLLWRATGRGRISVAVAGALATAAAVYIRPIAYGLVPILALCAALGSGQQRPKPGILPDEGTCTSGVRPWRLAAVYLAVTLSLLGLWHSRNFAAAGYPGFSAISAVNLYFYQGAATLAAAEQRPFAEVQRELGYASSDVYLARHPEQSTWSQARRLAFQRSEGLAIIRAHPALALRIYAAGLLRMAIDPGATEWLKLTGRLPPRGGLLAEVVDRGWLPTLHRLRRQQPSVFWLALGLGLVLAGYWLLAAAGALAPPVTARRARTWLVVVVVYLLAASGGAHSEGRFRQPLMPLLAILGGLAFARVERKDATNDR